MLIDIITETEELPHGSNEAYRQIDGNIIISSGETGSEDFY